MIYISKRQLDQVEYIIDQSKRGNHVLFNDEILHRVFFEPSKEPNGPSDAQAYSVEHHIERMIEKPTLEGKRAYLDELDSKTLELVVRTYFNIVENNIYESLGVRH